jgi:hypothetical protein
MAALTEIYVNPALASNTGTGSIGDPYGDVQYALNTATPDTTNGNRFNIKAGTAEIMTAPLSFLTWGVAPTSSAPLVFQGYTSAAGDGGIGELDGNNGGFPIYNDGDSGVTGQTHFKHLKMGNVGTSWVMLLNAYNMVDACEIHTANGDGITAGADGDVVVNCNINNIAGVGIDATGGRVSVIGNYLANGGTYTFTTAIQAGTSGPLITRNVISIGGSTKGIRILGYYMPVLHNAILSSGGTGIGIEDASDYMAWGGICANNAVEGFSGVGGIGIKSTTGDWQMLMNNAVYNCATAYSYPDQVVNAGDGNETLGATPFAKSGADTFANRLAYFAAANTGSVWGGAYPTDLNLDKGAIQGVGARRFFLLG